MYRIRKITRQDIPVCISIQHSSHFHPKEQLWNESYWYHVVLNLLKDSWVVIDDNDEVVGYGVGIIRYEDELHGELAWYFMDVCVRRKVLGVADDLMTFLMEKYPLMYAYIDVENKAVARWLKRHGWITIKTVKNYYSNGNDAYFVATN